MKYLTFVECTGGYYIFFKDKKIGTLPLYEDGYYSFVPEKGDGSWNAHILIEIANKLNELNAPLDKHLAEYFKT